MRTLIKHGTVITASDTVAADVLIEKGRIVALLAPGLSEATPIGTIDREVDARGCYLIPGGIDAHTHLDMPFGGTNSVDDFESGTVAAAHGGTTTLIDFAIQKKGGTLREALDTWHQKAEGKASIDYGFHMIATDVPPPVLEEMGQLVREGVTSFKLFMAYPGVLLLDDQSIFRAMLRAGEIGALICMHAETGLPIDVLIERALAAGHTAPVWHALTRPEAAEATGTERAIALAEMAKVPVYIVHLSAQRALERVMEARDRGLPAYAETCPQYLFLSEDALRGQPGNEFDGAKYVCTPPLRPAHHHEHLWRGLRNYDLQVVSTDHCPFCMKGQKELGKDNFAKIPNGMPGIETRLHLLWEGVREGRISMNRFVEITATAPARIFGLYPRKGTIAVGADADLVVWDPNKRFELSHKNLHMRADYASYEGKVVTGAPRQVYSRGELIVDNDRFLGKVGRGQFLRRATFGL
ncbi:MAG TPA: dihydropyrimidinase [Polyangia bacterium]|jgi:dihydropyrimidinase|nr:dihydropyrimidinase [Polyangia bacterium]